MRKLDKEKYEIHNAVVTKTRIDPERGLCLSVFCQGDGWGQALTFIANDSLGEAIFRMIEALRLPTFEDLPRTNVRIARLKSDGWNGSIRGIGHIVEDRWFFIDEIDFNKYNATISDWQ